MKKKHPPPFSHSPSVRAIIFSFLLLSLHGNAQNEFAPLGAKWSYTTISQFLDPPQNFSYSVSSDTIIDGKLCRVIKGKSNSYGETFFLEEYILWEQ